jgi:hypothetical protein
VLGWPKRCKLAHAFLWEYSCKWLKLGQLLGQLSVFLTWEHLKSCCSDRRSTGTRYTSQSSYSSVRWPAALRQYLGAVRNPAAAARGAVVPGPPRSARRPARRRAPPPPRPRAACSRPRARCASPAAGSCGCRSAGSPHSRARPSPGAARCDRHGARGGSGAARSRCGPCSRTTTRSCSARPGGGSGGQCGAGRQSIAGQGRVGCEVVFRVQGSVLSSIRSGASRVRVGVLIELSTGRLAPGLCSAR